MRKINLDSIPHLFHCLSRIACVHWSTFWARLAGKWWGARLGPGCTFIGRPRFKRHPGSHITIGQNCKFNSSHASNWIGVNRPCMLSTLKDGAQLAIGDGCGFSGTVIACTSRITIGHNVQCGANTLINDTDWHYDDTRVGPNAPVDIGDNVWLGVNVTVLKGVTIGEGTLVAAGSLVNKSLPAGVLAAGLPARVIRSLEERN